MRRSGHAKACERLLTSKQRLETEAGSEGFLAHTRFGAGRVWGGATGVHWVFLCFCLMLLFCFSGIPASRHADEVNLAKLLADSH